MSRRPVIFHLLLGLMVVLWSLNFIVGKVVLRELPPLLASGLRIAGAGLVMLPIYVLGERRRALPERADLPLLAVLGVAGIAMNQVLFLLGLKRTTVAHAALIFGLSPLLVLLVAAAAGQERITGRRVAGMLVALTGVLALQHKSSNGVTATAAGDLLVLAGATAFALFTVFGKPLAARYGTILMNTIGYVAGALVLAPLVIYEALRFPLGGVSWTAWAGIAYMVLFPSVACYLIFYHALKHLAASRLAALAYLQPLLATLMAIALLGERVTSSVAAGGALVLAGVWVAERG